MKAYKVKKIITTVLIYIDLIVVAAVIIYPLLWIVGSSLNESAGISRSSVIPEKTSLVNFITLFTKVQLRKMVS